MSDPPKPALCLESATRRRGPGSGFVLGPVSLEVPKGSRTVISGRSGAGKSTLLHLLAGLDRPDEGRVWIFETEVSRAGDATLASLRRERVGVVYQGFRAIEYLPVWRNVSVRLVPLGIPAHERYRRAVEMLRAVGLEDHADRAPATLSGGERQRVSLARALITQPSLLVADEPTSEVDDESAQVLIECFDRLSRRGTTLVIATHDAGLIPDAAIHLVLERGKVRA